MLDKMTNQLSFHSNALVLRAERQRAIASNIANADTPGYVARDFKFGDALREATGIGSSGSGTGTGSGVTRLAASGSHGTAGTTDLRHMPLPTVATTASIDRQGALGYAVQTQPSLDNNSVDLDRERANFVDNSVRYEATLRFINGGAKTMLSAIQGQ
ncbi:MAG: flagellar basal body protein [Acidovorax sp.]|uniref:flagellar basal body rod protein FlgB n=1 Tax=Acidovorax sp. TaxID=1872122 RepID=UPI0022C8CF44|nr:flagellar basal body protein [Acidovorax sp.]MCZ8219942.1 flagellar basal body protein [Acidovorax sp.]